MEYKLVYELGNVRSLQAIRRLLPDQNGAAVSSGLTGRSAPVVLFPLVDTRKFPDYDAPSISLPTDSEWRKMR
jgi:hypothetical protein